jgi:hypothetical protein
VAAISITDDELLVGRAAVAEAALGVARKAATHHLTKGLAGLGAVDADAEDAITDALINRNLAAHAWLSPYEVPWSLLVLRLLSGTVSSLAAPIAEARDRGATVPEIAAAIGITTQSVYATYADQVVRRRRTHP